MSEHASDVAATELAALKEAYDLSYRPQLGDETYYCLNILYTTLDAYGKPAGVENYRGGFRRTIDRIRDDGAVEETITWKHGARRTGGTDPVRHKAIASSSRPASKIILGDWESLNEWIHDFSYKYCAEDSYEDFHWGYDAFPREEATWIIGWNLVLLTVDAHFEFDSLRSKRHGAIDQLRKPGDSVLTPDSEHPFRLGLPPDVDVPAFTKLNLRSSFLGLTRKRDADCGVIGFKMDVSPFTMRYQQDEFALSSIFRGTLHVRLLDGVLEEGEFDEFVTGNNPAPVAPRYQIIRTDAATWEAGTLDLEFD